MNNRELNDLLEAMKNIDFGKLVVAADKLVSFIVFLELIKEYKGIDAEIIQDAFEEMFGLGSYTSEQDDLDKQIEAMNSVVGFIVLLELIQDYKKENKNSDSSNGSDDDDKRIQKAFLGMLGVDVVDKKKDKMDKLKEALKKMPSNEWF